MSYFSTPFINKTKEYVGGFIGDNFSEKICYHNIDHTIDVVNASEYIGRKCEISDEDMETLLIAAWFHDTGYYLGCENHEAESASIAEEYLKSHNYPEKRIRQIANCILSTKLPQQPKSLLEKIICDADLFHLSSDQFYEKSQLLLHEISFQSNTISREKWIIDTLDFIDGFAKLKATGACWIVGRTDCTKLVLSKISHNLF